MLMYHPSLLFYSAVILKLRNYKELGKNKSLMFIIQGDTGADFIWPAGRLCPIGDAGITGPSGPSNWLPL
jgi:hypothetical protein